MAASAYAQDPFEIHVYEYETLKPGQFTLEQHLNYWAIGSKQFEGRLAPANDQLHMTYELTGAITDQVSLGFMQLNAVLPGTGFEYAGLRVCRTFMRRLPGDCRSISAWWWSSPLRVAIHRRHGASGRPS